MDQLTPSGTGLLGGQVALVTGSTRGIGKGIAESLAAAGAMVIVTGRSEDAARTVAQEISAGGGRAEHLGADLNDDEAVESLIPRVLSQFGSLDILVNNAGIDGDHPVVGYSLELWRKILRINLEVPFRLCRAAGPHFLERKRGVVINISSVQGQIGIRDNCAYAASKHGLIGLTQVLSDEWAGEGVRANVIAPGLIDTDMVKYLTESPKFQDWLGMKVPARRVGTPKDVGDVAVFLASDAAAYVHGTVIPVDGGYLAS